MSRRPLSPGIPRVSVGISLTEPTALLLDQWAEIMVCEYEEQYPKEEGHWPQSKSQVIEEAFELWLQDMICLEETADPVGFTAYCGTLIPADAEALRTARYVTAAYFPEQRRLDDSPYDIEELLFEGEVVDEDG